MEEAQLELVSDFSLPFAIFEARVRSLDLHDVFQQGQQMSIAFIDIQ
jgi:hypothetical protein